MSRRPRYWIKFYHEVLMDAKIARLSDSLWRRFFECCLIAGETYEEGFLPALPDMAWQLHVDEEALATELSQLAQRGLLELRGDADGVERWFVTNFAKRQARDTDAERMQRYRERKRDESVTKRNGNVTVRNDDVTVRNQEEETKGETDKNTDINVDKERKNKEPSMDEMAAGGGRTRILELLDEFGINEPKRSEIAAMEGLTLGYVREHLETADNLGQAIHRILNRWTLSKKQRNKKRPPSKKSGTDSAFEAFLRSKEDDAVDD